MHDAGRKRNPYPSRRRGTLRLALVLLYFACLGCDRLWAGGGPENVLLVVNPLRVDSLTVANHYASLRQIPDANLFFLEWNGSTENVSVDDFRNRILEPILKEIEDRRLDRQIDYIVYSSGFPFAVDFASDFSGNVQQSTGRLASLTSMTYLYQLVRDRDLAYAYGPGQFRSNFYEGKVTRGFAQQRAWQQNGQPTNLGGRQYYLSMMLGYTDGRGNTVDEIVDYLQRAALADGWRPKGTIYLMRVANEIRSSTRDPVFPHVVAALEQEGVTGLIEEGVLPSSRRDVMGAVIGRATFNWTKSRCQILPGAICEHLTSFGGDLRQKATQTPFTEHLRHGAAGSSGTVAEPMALQEKFPHPWMHVHYARGASLAEAFYQSISSPYQLLIAGDPLCRPWARIPQVRAEGLEPNQRVSGTVQITPLAAPAVPVKEFRLFVDGRLIETCPPGNSFQIDTTKVADGFHELRLVGIEDSMIESQGRLRLPILVDNRGLSLETAVQPATTAGRVTVQVKAPGAKTIFLFHHRRPVGRVQGEQGVLAVDPQMCGRGPVTLTAVALGDGGSRVYSRPIQFVMPETLDVMSLKDPRNNNLPN